MRLEEIAEAVSMAGEGEPIFHPTKQLLDPLDVLTFCPSLVVLTKREEDYGERKEVIELRLAHFSVKEYLVSQRIPANLRIEDFPAHKCIAKTCVAYLLHLDFRLTREKATMDYPLLRYAAMFWPGHAGAIPNCYSDSVLDQMILNLLNPDKLCHWNALRAHNPERVVSLHLRVEELGSPLYYASLLGLLNIVRALIGSGVDVNAHGGRYGNALQAAACSGEERVIKLLLDAGANVNARGGHFGNALQAAACSGNETMIQLLLNAGARVNSQGGRYGNALQASAKCRSESMTQLLLDAGAKVNAQRGHYGTALQAAARSGSENTIQLLLAAGADVNAEGGKYGSPLHAAVRRGNESAIQLLLDAGANVNVQRGKYGSPLQTAAACFSGSQTAIKQLLDAKADVNAQGEIHGSTLKPALNEGYQKTIELLIANREKASTELEVGSDSFYSSEFDEKDYDSEEAEEDHAHSSPAPGALPSAIYYYYLLQDSACRSLRQSLLFFRVIWNWVKLHFCAAMGALVASFWSSLF